MTKVYIVGGDNGMGNSGTGVFGMYPTEELAQARVKFLEQNDFAEYLYYEAFEVGPNGADFEFNLGG